MGTSRRLIALVITSVAAPLLALLVTVVSGRLAGFSWLAFVAAGMGVPMLLADRRIGAAAVGLLAGAAALATGCIAAPIAAAIVHAVGVPLLARHMPELPRAWRAWLWAVLALLTVANSARLTAFMADPHATWGATLPFVEASTRHICMAAYVRAGELAPSADDLYDRRYYQPETESTVTGLAPNLGCPYEYPPPFLLVPAAGLALTHDFLLLRAGWYAVQALLIGALLLLITKWMRDARVGLLLPLLWISPPMMFDLQFGQVHLLVIAASVAAMVAFSQRRDGVGGALLGAAVAIKLFPGLLLVYLAARRRWRALAWTSVTMVAAALLVLPVLGAGPWTAFVTKQLPRLQSGEAFAFFEGDPGVIAGNFSIYGLVFKLDLLGLADMTRRAAGQLAWVYTAFLVVLAWRIGRRPSDAGDRGADVRTWLGLLNLAALRSPLAPGMYVASGAVWMFVLLAATAERRGGWLWTRTAFAWILAGGAPPLASPAMSVLASLPSQVIYIVANAWPLGRRARMEGGESRGMLQA